MLTLKGRESMLAPAVIVGPILVTLDWPGLPEGKPPFLQAFWDFEDSAPAAQLDPSNCY